MEELHLRHQEMRQLQSDVAVREDFIAQLRTQATAGRTTLNAVRSELLHARAELAKHVAESHRDRTRIAAEAAEGQLERASVAAQVADTRRELGVGAELLTKASSERDLARQQTADARARLEAISVQLEKTNRELLAVRAYANSAGFQLVERIGVRLRRHTRLYRTLQSAVRKMAS
jgi:chromosome segregation ATPase